MIIASGGSASGVELLIVLPSHPANASTATNAGVVVTYKGLLVSQLTRPARVMWDYGDRIFDETVNIGNSVTFGTVDDPVVKAALRMDL